MKYKEKLTVLIVLFLVVFIATGAIIGVYVKTKNENEPKKNSIILENINQF